MDHETFEEIDRLVPERDSRRDREVRELRAKLHQAMEECAELKVKQSSLRPFFQMLKEKVVHFEHIVFLLKEQIQHLQKKHTVQLNESQKVATEAHIKISEQIRIESQNKSKEWEDLFTQLEGERIRLRAELRDAGLKLQHQHERERQLSKKIEDQSKTLTSVESEIATLRVQKETLESEVAAVKSEMDKCINSYIAKETESTELKFVLKKMKQKMEELSRVHDQSKNNSAHLKKELERLKTVYPLRDLIKIKEGQIEATQKDLAQIPDVHPEKKRLEGLLAGMIREKEALRRIAQEMGLVSVSNPTIP
jgi:chromosome segregation ATPase